MHILQLLKKSAENNNAYTLEVKILKAGGGGILDARYNSDSFRYTT